LLVLFTIVDLSVYGLSYSVYGRTVDLQQFVARSPHPPEPGAYRIAAVQTSDGLRAGNRVLLAGSTRVDGYAGLEPAKRLDYQNASALRLAGTQWTWWPALAKANSPAAWSPVEAPAPRVRLISKTAPPAALRDLATLHLDAAVVEPEVQLDTTATGSATLAVDRDGLLVVDVQSDGQQLLATTESFHSGWQATADGRDVPVVRVNGDFLGCVLGPGAARVALEFRPASLRVGKILSWCGLGLWVCTLAVRLPLGRSRNCRDRRS
jgi:hypothetical protein